MPEEGGGEVYLADVLGGWGNLAKDGWNVFGGLNFRKQEPMKGTERDFMQTSYITVARVQRTEFNDVPGELQPVRDRSQRQPVLPELRAAHVDLDTPERPGASD